MAEEALQLVSSRAPLAAPTTYKIDFSGQQRQADGVKYRLGVNAFGGPVAHKVALTADAEQRLRRELEVSRYLQTRGGELLSKCLMYDLTTRPPSVVVTYRGRPLADLVHDDAQWPLEHTVRMKLIADLLQGLELLRVSRIVHGALNVNTLHWDGSTLQITDFGRAALCGEYPDGRPAHHGDDIEAAGRIIYYVHTGQLPPSDPAELRYQVEHVQDADLRDLLLRRDLVTGDDLDYVFAVTAEARPTSHVLLRRLDRRPHGVQWEHLVARDRAAREEFRNLRQRQQRFRATLERWQAQQRARPRWAPRQPSPRGTVPPAGSGGPGSRPARANTLDSPGPARPSVPWPRGKVLATLAIAAAAGAVVVLIGLLL